MFLSNRRSRWDPPTHTHTHTLSQSPLLLSCQVSFCKYPCSAKDIFYLPAHLLFPTSNDPPSTSTHTSLTKRTALLRLHPVRYSQPLSTNSHQALSLGTPRSEAAWGANAQLQPELSFPPRPLTNPPAKWSRRSYVWIQLEWRPWRVRRPFTMPLKK